MSIKVALNFAVDDFFSEFFTYTFPVLTKKSFELLTSALYEMKKLPSFPCTLIIQEQQ